MSDTAPASPMPDVEWVDLPPIERNPIGGGRQNTLLERFAPFFDALRSRPGEWALFDTKPRRAAANSRAHRQRVLGVAGFEIAVRTVDGKGNTYIRYVGGES